MSPLSRAQRAAARPGQSLPAHTAGAASQGVKSFSLGEWRNIVIVRVWVLNTQCSFGLATVFMQDWVSPKNANGKCILSVKWTVYLVFYFALRIRVEIIYDV